MSTSYIEAMLAGTDFPLRIGSADAFARTRAFLQKADFNDVAVCCALSIEHMDDLGKATWDKLDSLPAALRWCIDVFLRTVLTAEAEARAICGEATLDAMIELSLLRPAKYQSGSLVCPVWLYPVDGFVVASDLKADPDSDVYVERDDIVFPAIDSGTIRFLRLMPDAPGGAALDLCGGCGIGALHQSRTAHIALTSDITPRSAMYAAFNIALNNVSATSLCGDLFEPVRGQQFDVITAHPPFVPSINEHVIYRDGGDRGEDVTRRTIEGLPTYLRPGGTAMVLCAGNDTNTGTFEQRALAWLGAAASEFEIVFGMQRAISLDSIVESARRRKQQPLDERGAAELNARLIAQETRQLAYGALVMHRHQRPVAAEPIRVPMALMAHIDDFRRLMAWRQQNRRADFAQRFAAARPRLSPRLQCNARYIVDDGQLVSDEFIFSAQGGMPWTLRAELWMVPLLSGIDGRRTVTEIYKATRAANGLPDGYELTDFTRLLNLMVERGFLDVPPA
jgi:methylase of polypeptide subunit release factors